ncbi:MAG TPA: peptide chain release factor 1 [Candidatus Xenobia bacterium]|jgi:peptide chain release factor 1
MNDKLDAVARRYEALTERLCDPALISNQSEYGRVAKERSGLEPILAARTRFLTVQKDLESARALYRTETEAELKAYAEAEVEALDAQASKLERELLILLLPKDPFADRNLFMEIRAGAGGEEAALFAGELFRAYARYAEGRGWKVEVMSANNTELGGMKEVVFGVSGDNVYPRLKHESGVHRVQRVPATEASGRIHTSTVTVAVMAEAEDIDIHIDPKDLEIDTYRSQGAGGQHVNKTESAIRITHVPSGVVVACQDERSQHQNKDKAMRMLRAKLLEAETARQEQEIAQNRRSQVGSGDRSEKIRTYNFKENRITDHRIGLTLHSLDQALEGNLDPLLDALVSHDEQQRLQAVGA